MAELKECDEDAVFSPPPMGRGLSPVAPRSVRSKKTRPIKLKENRRMTAGSEVLAPRRARLKSGFSKQLEAQKERMEGESGREEKQSSVHSTTTLLDASRTTLTHQITPSCDIAAIKMEGLATKEEGREDATPTAANVRCVKLRNSQGKPDNNPNHPNSQNPSLLHPA
jgi:hypothetical protein